MGNTRLTGFLPGKQNSALRRRILRDERDMIPAGLRLHGAEGAPHQVLGVPTPPPQQMLGVPIMPPQQMFGVPMMLGVPMMPTTTSRTGPAVFGPAPNLRGQWAMPPTPSPDAACFAEATTAATPMPGSKRRLGQDQSLASMDARQPAGQDPAVCARRGCPDRPATSHPPTLPAEQHESLHPVSQSRRGEWNDDTERLRSILATRCIE